MPKPSAAAWRLHDRGRQLAVVAGQHYPIAPLQGHPAAWFGALACLVDHAEIESPRAQQVAVQAGRGRAQDVGVVQDVFSGLPLQTPGVRQQAPGLLACLLPLARLWLGPRILACLSEQPHGLFDQLVGQSDIRMVLHQEIEGVASEIGHDTGGVPETYGLLPGCHQAFEDVVHGQVARRAGQDLLAAPDHPADQFDDRGGLSGARRTVDQGYVTGSQGELNGLSLGVVEQ